MSDEISGVATAEEAAVHVVGAVYSDSRGRFWRLVSSTLRPDGRFRMTFVSVSHAELCPFGRSDKLALWA